MFILIPGGHKHKNADHFAIATICATAAAADVEVA
jgi:hypothetical protein